MPRPEWSAYQRTDRNSGSKSRINRGKRVIKGLNRSLDDPCYFSLVLLLKTDFKEKGE
jgi:hypothetical protein